MGAVYCIFDGDEDRWAHSFLKGWDALKNINFNFEDAHDLGSMTSSAQDEAYVKRQLRERMKRSSVVLLLLGEKTKNLYKYVRWELELAIELDLPIIVANLNEYRQMDTNRCPAILRNHCAVHIAYKKDLIKFALQYWPSGFAKLTQSERASGWRYYNDQTYRELGL